MTAAPPRPAHNAAIRRCCFVCFDAFSALLTRNVLYPEHNLQRLYQQLTRDGAMPASLHALDEHSFVAGRLHAERHLRRDLDQGLSTSEQALQQIWTLVLSSTPGQTATARTLAAAELEIERASLRVHVPGRGILNEARRLGKRVVAINRSWVPAPELSSWLDALGIPVDRVVDVSGARTAPGKNRFAAFCSDPDIRPADILYVAGEHTDALADTGEAESTRLLVADNRSRIMGPRLSSWVTLPLASSAALALAANTSAGSPASENSQQELLARLGRSMLGPALGGFTAWIGHIADHAGVDRVVFSSRDGWLPYQVAGSMAWSKHHCLRYGFFSRRSLYIPGFAGGLDDQDIKLLTGGLWPTPVGQLLKRCGLDPAEHARAIAAAGFRGADSLVMEAHERQRMGELFRHLEPVVRVTGEHELEQLAAYLEHIGLAHAKRLLFVDIGWRGTLQRGLRRCLRLLGSSTEVIGVYLGILWTPIAYDGQNALGWLCDETRDPRTHDVISRSIPLFEACFQADQPGVMGYRDGAPLFDSDARSRELCDPLQAAALEYCRDALPLLDAGARHPIMGRPLLHLAAHPTPREAAILGRYIYADGFGASDEERPLLRLPEHLRSRDDLRRLRNERDITSWRPGLDALLAERGWLEAAYDTTCSRPPLFPCFSCRNPRGKSSSKQAL